jgi:hypothetical protein
MSLTLIVSCKKDKTDTPLPTPQPVNQLTVAVSNTVDGTPVVFGQMVYTNPFGSAYSVDLLKYYITNFRLVGTDSSVYNLHNYDLINAADTSTCSFAAQDIPEGTYCKVRFYLGVDPDSNHTGTQSGDLDPVNGMIWTWNTGYIFFKHEGQFRDTAGNVQDLLYHFGTDPVLTEVEIPITPFTVGATDKKTIHLEFDLNGVYGSYTIVDFNGNNIRQSLSVDDRPWMTDLVTNFPGAFRITSID